MCQHRECLSMDAANGKRSQVTNLWLRDIARCLG